MATRKPKPALRPATQRFPDCPGCGGSHERAPHMGKPGIYGNPNLWECLRALVERVRELERGR